MITYNLATAIGSRWRRRLSTFAIAAAVWCGLSCSLQFVLRRRNNMRLDLRDWRWRRRRRCAELYYIIIYIELLGCRDNGCLERCAAREFG